MQRKKAGWKKPAILFLALLLLLQIADLVRLRYFDSACHLPVLISTRSASTAPSYRPNGSGSR